MSIIYVIRHAQASFGEQNYDRLSETGKCQAQILADHFAALGLEFDAIYMGRQVRHEETLAPLLDRFSENRRPRPPVVKTDSFNEYDSETIIATLIPEMIRQDPTFETAVAGMFVDRRAFQKVYGTLMEKWIRGEYASTDLESWPLYFRRVADGVREIMQDQGSGKTVALFTSGGPIAIWVQQALGLADHTTLTLTWQIMNTSVTRFKFSGDRLTLFGFNDIGHLERTKDRRLITYR